MYYDDSSTKYYCSHTKVIMNSLQCNIEEPSIPNWAYEGKAPSVYTFFEAVTLAGLAGKPFKLSAKLQRALLGAVVFGRREIVVQADNSVKCTIGVAFGQDFETAVWSARTIERAAGLNKQLRPGTSGANYL